MTNYDMLAEGSHKTWGSIMRQQEEDRITKLEKKALKRAPAGVETVYLKTSSLRDRMMLETRGWAVDATTSIGVASVTRFIMRIAREELSERVGIARRA